MLTQLECIPYTVNSYRRLVDIEVIPEEKREDLMRQLLDFLSGVDYRVSPPAMEHELSKEADMVISKGQGNLEGLMEVKHDNIYYMLVTKCELIADRIRMIKTRKDV